MGAAWGIWDGEKNHATDLRWTNTLASTLNGGGIQSCFKFICGTKNTVSLRGRTLIYFTLSKSNRGAVNLAAQKQLSESRGMRGRKRQRVEREKGDEESETQRQFGLIMLIFFPSSAKQKHPGTFRHTTGDQSLLSFSFSPHRVFL